MVFVAGAGPFRWAAERRPFDATNMARLADCRQLFLAYLRHECGLSANTLEAYDRDLVRFLSWLDTTTVRRWEDLTLDGLARYLGFLADLELSPASVARHVASLKMFFRYLVLDGFVQQSVAELLNRPSLWERIPHVLSERQVTALLSAPIIDDRHCWRDRAILEMMYATGTRASEVASLRVADVYLDQRYCKCTGKGNKQRIVPFGHNARHALSLYLERLRPKLTSKEGDSGMLFLTRGGQPMSRIDVWKLVKKYARRVGVANKVSPHTLRHSFATHLLAQGADLRVIQELLGHSSIATTQHYTRVDATRLKRIHSQFHPRG